MNWPVVALAAALGAAVIGGLLLAASLVRRRRRHTREEETTEPAALDPDLAFDNYLTPDAGGSVWPTARGSAPQPHLATDATSGERQSVPNAGTTGVSFESLTRAPQREEAARRMDPRETLAAAQRARISDPELKWRRTSRARVRESVDGGEAFIFAHAIRRTSAEVGFASLTQRQAVVSAELGTDLDRIGLAWPRELLLDYDGGVSGYFAPALDCAFVVDVPHHGRAVRTLGAAMGLTDGHLEALGSQDLLELIRLVAVWMAALHEAGVVFGDLGQRSIAYATSPVRIRVLDYDTARPLGGAALLPPDPLSDADPLTPAGESSYDTDRFLFAQLAFRLLVSRTPAGSIAPDAVPSRLLGLDEQGTDTLRRLWQRATGPWGTRPAMQEWVAALEPVRSTG